MVKQEIKVDEGFENTYELLLSEKEKIEEMVRKQVEERTAKIDEIIKMITTVVEVEVPDEVVEETATEETQMY